MILFNLYTDQNGKFLVMSNLGNWYIIILYERDGSLILVKPMKTKSSGEMNRAYNKFMQQLQDHGVHAKKHILDKEATNVFWNNMIKWHWLQKLPPHIDRQNVTEKAISMFKDWVDSTFLMHLWDRLLSQAEATLNMMRPANLVPTISVYAYMYGQHDFDKIQ